MFYHFVKPSMKYSTFCRRIAVGFAGDSDLSGLHRGLCPTPRGPEGGPVPRGPGASSGPVGDR